MVDIRKVLGRGEYGEGVIDGADLLEDDAQAVKVWEFYITIGEKKYVVSRGVLQTEGWQPRKGDKVRFDRQPEGVDDTYLHASLVGE